MMSFTCDVCTKPINDEKDDYEIHDMYQKGEHFDTFVCHTDCRIKQDEKSTELELKERGQKS